MVIYFDRLNGVFSELFWKLTICTVLGFIQLLHSEETKRQREEEIASGSFFKT